MNFTSLCRIALRVAVENYLCSWDVIARDGRLFELTELSDFNRNTKGRLGACEHSDVAPQVSRIASCPPRIGLLPCAGAL